MVLKFPQTYKSQYSTDLNPDDYGFKSWQELLRSMKSQVKLSYDDGRGLWMATLNESTETPAATVEPAIVEIPASTPTPAPTTSNGTIPSEVEEMHVVDEVGSTADEDGDSVMELEVKDEKKDELEIQVVACPAPASSTISGASVRKENSYK